MTHAVDTAEDDLASKVMPLISDLAAEIGEAKKQPAAAGVNFAGVDAALERLRLVGYQQRVILGPGPAAQEPATDHVDSSSPVPAPAWVDDPEASPPPPTS